MRVGTSGFVGQRLREAREARGLSGVDLADMLGVTPQLIYAYQSGDATPSPQVMEIITERLGFPTAFFMRAPLADDNAGIFWRANNSATRIAQRRAEARLIWLKELMSYLRDYFDFPEANIPSLPLPKNFRSLTSEHIEVAANSCRSYWGLSGGPLPDVIGILESNGIIVAQIKVDAEDLDAFSQWSSLDNTPYVVLSCDKPSAVRSRFDAAHELGHLILHRHIDRKRLNDSKDWKLLEDQAHRFASAFLLPAPTFSKEIWAPSLDTFISLKQRWKVSAAAMIMRCRYLGVISEEQEKRLWINRNRRGWPKVEPLDDKIERETPNLIPRAIEMLVDENVRRRDQIVSDLSIPPTDLEEIGGVPFGYFRTQTAPVVPIPKASTFVRSNADDEGNVVNLFDRAKES